MAPCSALQRSRAQGYLGGNVADSGKSFDLDVRLGAGAYICGEETSLLESLEGKRGQIRPKPPLPAIRGLFGKPTVVNNVISLATVPIVLEKGAEHYRDFGMGKSRGTLTIQLAGNIKYGGLVEKAFGLALRQAIYDFGGGTATGRPLRAVRVGGPLGAYFPESLLDTPLDYEAFAALKGLVGHGAVVVFDDTVDLAKDGTFKNAERRLGMVRNALPPMNGYGDWEITMMLSNALGYPMHYSHPSEIMAEIARLTPTFADVTYEKLNQLGSFVRGKGRFMITEFLPTDERTSRKFPLLLTTGRILTSRAGETTLHAHLTERVQPGVVYTTFHHGFTGANVVTTEFTDWATDGPEYKVTAVEVALARRISEWQKKYLETRKQTTQIQQASRERYAVRSNGPQGEPDRLVFLRPPTRRSPGGRHQPHQAILGAPHA